MGCGHLKISPFLRSAHQVPPKGPSKARYRPHATTVLNKTGQKLTDVDIYKSVIKEWIRLLDVKSKSMLTFGVIKHSIKSSILF